MLCVMMAFKYMFIENFEEYNKLRNNLDPF